MSNNKNAAVKILVRARKWIQAIVGFGMYALVAVFGISLWWVLAAGAFAGVIFGKVFCRWACPMGFVMEAVTGAGGANSKFQQMYQYHKLGCPIAWVSGALNKYSLFKVKLDKTGCSSCGLCDKACYLSTIEPAKFSLFDDEKTRPGTEFACSKCLACVTACPSGSLSFGPGKNEN